jgi:hypothetical protein
LLKPYPWRSGIVWRLAERILGRIHRGREC